MRGTNFLSDRTIKAALKCAAAENKTVVINDGGGLTLEAQPYGAGWWRLRYLLAGKVNRLSVGTCPDTPLALGRRRRDEARQMIAAGSEPGEAKKAQKVAIAARKDHSKLLADGKLLPGTFQFVATEWLERVHRIKVSKGHADRTETRLKQDVFPCIGSRPIREIEPPELLKVLRKVEDRGAIETTHRIKDACGKVFATASTRAIASGTPPR